MLPCASLQGALSNKSNVPLVHGHDATIYVQITDSNKIFAVLIKESAPYSMVVQLSPPLLSNLIIVMYIISMHWPLFTSFAYYIG